MSFDDLGLGAEVLRAVADAGYKEPTPIQRQAIPQVLMGRDVLGCAQTGTGKTASFTLPMIEILHGSRARARMPRSLIIEPTRELAAQVAENFDVYGKYHKLSKALLIGGVQYGDQEKVLDRGVDVLIATPGRLLDHFERGRLLLSGVQMMVVDEADRMLDMGFIPDIERIFKLTPFTRQTLFFSATMPPEIQRLTDQFLHAPKRIEVAKPATTAATVTQRVVQCPSSDAGAKRAALRAVIRAATLKATSEGTPDGIPVNPLKNAIVFCNRKRDVDVVAKSLAKHGFDAAPIHGDLPQSVRTATLERFRNGALKILIASDVAARGLDIPEVSHVFNYDVPHTPDDYVHRIGRTGRAGRTGETFMIVSPGDAKALAAIVRLIGQDIPTAADVPGLDEIGDEPAYDRARHGRRDRDRPRERTRSTGRERHREHAHERAAPREPSSRNEETAAHQGGQDEASMERPTRQRPAHTRQPTARPQRGEEPDSVVGLGDHVPAFLAKPTGLKAS